MKKLLLFASIVIIITSCKDRTSDPKTEIATTDSVTANSNTPSFDSGYADINGLKMYYEVHGQGKPIVLIHGSFMTIPLNWSNIIPALAKDRKVIVAEMQGHGRTKDISREFSYENMADDISGLLKHLKIDSADVLGYSMGAGVAFQTAIRHPEQVRRLVILSGTFRHNGWWPDVEAAFGTFTADMFKGSPIEKEYVRFGNDPAHFPEFVKKVISIDLKPYDWTQGMKKIQSPVFMAIGDADGVRYEHALELFRAKGGGKMGDLNGLPQSRLAILPGTTHIGMMNHASWWIPMLTDFLNWNLDPTPPTF